MTFFYMPEKIVLAHGAQGACIYDLRRPTAVLYRLDAEATVLVNALLAGESALGGDSSPGSELLSTLLKVGLLCEGIAPVVAATDNVPRARQAAWIEVTSKCQLQCVYCYGDFGGKDYESMTPASAALAVDELLANGFYDLRIIGGEPLLEESLVREMVNRIRTMPGTSVEIFTNGLLLTPEFVDFCRRQEVRLVLGLYGADRSECQNVTGVARVHERQQDVFRMLNEIGVPFRVSITRNRYNNNASLTKLASIYGIHQEALREDHVRSVGRGRIEVNSIDADGDRHSPFTITEAVFRRRIPSDKILRRLQGGHDCFASRVCVSPSLDVYPCTMERSVSYGNLSHLPLETILELGKPYRQAGKDSIASCRKCEYRYACFDCRVQRESPEGDFFSKPRYCAYDPEIGVWSTH